MTTCKLSGSLIAEVRHNTYYLKCSNTWYQRKIDLTRNFLVAVVNTLNNKTHSSKEIAEFSFENADVKSNCYCKQRMKSKLSLSSDCVETKLCKPCTSFTSHPHSSCGIGHKELKTGLHESSRVSCKLAYSSD